MASHIMDKVLETEALCDEMKASAKRQASQILDEAEVKAGQMRRQARDFAKDKAKTVKAEAETKASLLLAESERETREQIESLTAACAGKKANAVKQTALYLLELAKGG